MSKYTGAVAFINGVHYPVKGDYADTGRPLRWDGDGYRDAEKGEPLHNDANHQNELVVEPGSEG